MGISENLPCQGAASISRRRRQLGSGVRRWKRAEQGPRGADHVVHVVRVVRVVHVVRVVYAGRRRTPIHLPAPASEAGSAAFATAAT
jgi:hypothetical protein